MIIGKKFIGFTSKGIRPNNEDYILPSPDSFPSENDLFIVCDGVGGAARGETASKIAADSFAEFILKRNPSNFSDDLYNMALQYTEGKMDEYIRFHPSARGMATTIALIYFCRSGAELAWCGDSRIYHVRGNSILFQSEDHSQVNMMAKAGLIKKEEIVSHPDKNILMRAIQGASIKKTKIETAQLTEIFPGDYFFICSDGVWEVVSNEILAEICSGPGSIELKTDNFKQICSKYSHDNYSGFLIEIENVQNEEIQSGIVDKEEDEIPFARMI